MFKHFQQACLLNKDKHVYKRQEITQMTEQFIGLSLESFSGLKKNIQFEEKMLAFKTQLQSYQQGFFEVPDLTDPCNVVDLLTWDGQMTSAQGFKMIKIGNDKFICE